MPLSEEDEIFVERAFQRTLVELNKLISFSGTPTVVWRRTGEICLVGTEFCLLTGWRREDLLGGKKYIFEIFDTSSVVEYYEHFAKHAFESTSSSVMTQAVVLGPSGKPVPCAFSFSVRRDLFSVGLSPFPELGGVALTIGVPAAVLRNRIFLADTHVNISQNQYGLRSLQGNCFFFRNGAVSAHRARIVL